MKLATIIATLETIEATKALAAELKTAAGTLAAEELEALPARLTTAETQAGELRAAVVKLNGDAAANVKTTDELRATVARYDGEKRSGLIATAFAAAAKTAGLPEAAIPTALKLVDQAAINVDLAKGQVTGITAETFAGLKTAHPILFTVAAAAAQTIPALPPAGPGAAAAATGVAGYVTQFPQ